MLTAVVGAPEMFDANVLRCSLDEGAGTNLLDSSGAGRNAVLVGNPSWVTNGILGGALRFNGTNDCVRQTAGTNQQMRPMPSMCPTFCTPGTLAPAT